MDQQKKQTEYLAELEETYQTGRTEPPKSYGGVIAVLLGLVILLCGLTTALSLLNIRMFWQLNAPTQPSDLSLSFSRISEPAATMPNPTEAAPTPTQPPLNMVLQTVPPTAPPPPKEEDLSGQTLDVEELPLEDIPADMPELPVFPVEQVEDQIAISLVTVDCGTESRVGLVLSSDGYILTGSAGLSDPEQIRVQIGEQVFSEVTFIGKDDSLNLAVLHVDAAGLIPAAFCDSSSLAPGEQLAAFPSRQQTQLVQSMPGLLQTDTSAAAGEPLLNTHGQVVGIAVPGNGASPEEGYVVPSTQVKAIAEQLIRDYVPEQDPCLGLDGESLSLFYQLYYELPEGFYITAVDDASDAFLKGITVGDILVSINGVPLSEITELSDAIEDFTPGQVVTVVVFRAGQTYELNITLGEKD